MMLRKQRLAVGSGKLRGSSPSDLCNNHATSQYVVHTMYVIHVRYVFALTMVLINHKYHETQLVELN